MNEAEFLAVSVAHQFGDHGRVRLCQTDATRAAAIAGSSGSMLAWNHRRQAPYPVNGWRLADDGTPGIVQGAQRVALPKPLGALAALRAAGADFDLLIDMQDRRVRNLVLSDEMGGDEVHPVFGFNRLPGAPGRLLVPLPGYHDIGAPDFLGGLDPAAVPWSAKMDRFAWRGVAGGRANPELDVRREGKRLRPTLRNLTAGQSDLAAAEKILGTFPRHRFVARYVNDPRADVGFVDGNGFILAAEPLLASLERPRIPRPAFQNYKYLVVLRGLDIGSSFFWTMNSGSLGLVMETPFESFASVHFRPWEHYVPFREDMADFEERLGWCAANAGACQEMVRNAAATCRLLGRADLRDQIARDLVSTLRARFG